jgi:hypothetical protein
MAVAQVAQVQRQAAADAASDARLACGVAAGCAVALGAFVLLPYAVGEEWLPSGLGLLWMLGGVAVVLLGPVAAGLAGWSSLVTLWVRGDPLTASARRTHLVTLLLVAAYAVGLFAAWAGGVLAWFSD